MAYIGKGVIGVEHPSTSALTATSVTSTGAVSGTTGTFSGIVTTDQIKNSSGKPILNSAGSVLQIQSSVSTAASTITGTSYADIPSMTATITPSSTNSKILVQVSFGAMGSSGTSHGCLMKLLRGSTEIGQGASADTHNVFMQNYFGATNRYWSISHMFVDSPSSTSSLVYKMQWEMTGTGETFYINRRGIDNYARLSSTFLLTEIAG